MIKHEPRGDEIEHAMLALSEVLYPNPQDRAREMATIAPYAQDHSESGTTLSESTDVDDPTSPTEDSTGGEPAPGPLVEKPASIPHTFPEGD